MYLPNLSRTIVVRDRIVDGFEKFGGVFHQPLLGDVVCVCHKVSSLFPKDKEEPPLWASWDAVYFQNGRTSVQIHCCAPSHHLLVIFADV
jgi:hypothetical protein